MIKIAKINGVVSIDVDDNGTIDKSEMKLFVLQLFQANRNIQFKAAEQSPLYYDKRNQAQDKKDVVWQAYLENKTAGLFETFSSKK